MRFFASLADWLVQRVFWLSIVAMASTAQADIILYQQTPGTSFEFAEIQAGEVRSQAIDLTQAARLEQIALNIAQPWQLSTTGPPLISLWIDRTPGSRSELVYTGGLRSSWTGLAVYLPAGRSWLSVESLAGSIVWVSPTGTTGGALTTLSGTVATSAYAGTLRGTPVPEPSGFIPAVIVGAIVGAGVVWRRVFRNTH